MTAFATHDDLAARLGLTLTSGMQTRADTLLELASDVIRNEVKQQIGLVADDEITIPGTTDERILLPERPVVSVASVVLNGHELGQGTDWYLEGDEIARVPASMTLGVGGLLDTEYVFPLGTGFGWEEQSIVITYTHGYATVPALVKAIVLEMVVRVWVNPGSVARETVGDTQTVYDNMRFSPSGLLPTDEEKKQLRRLFGRSGTSVSIGAGP